MHVITTGARGLNSNNNSKIVDCAAALPQLQLFGPYLCRWEASILVLLPCEPSDDVGGVAQVFSCRRSTEFGQQHVGADLHRQRGWRFCCCLRPVEETSYKHPSIHRHKVSYHSSNEAVMICFRRTTHLVLWQLCPGAAEGEHGSPCLQPGWRHTPAEL